MASEPMTRTPTETMRLAALERARPLVALLTVRQVIEAGDDAIAAAGLNPWCMNEGLARGDEPIGAHFIERAIATAKGEDRT